jgi:hypothetical protein
MGVKLRRSCGGMAIPPAPRIETDLYRLKRQSGSLCRIFERTPFGGDFEIVGDDIRRKYGVIDLSIQKQRKKGMSALSLPRRERTPLSATGAWVPFASDPTTLRLRFRSCKVSPSSRIRPSDAPI